MNTDNTTSQHIPTLRELYPSFTEDEMKETDQNLWLYLDFTLRVYDRICNDNSEYKRFRALIQSPARPKSEHQKSEAQSNPSTP